MEDFNNKNDKLIYEWIVPENHPRLNSINEDMAHGYRIYYNRDTVGGLFVARLNKNGKWEINNGSNRHLIAHLIKQITELLGTVQKAHVSCQESLNNIYDWDKLVNSHSDKLFLLIKNLPKDAFFTVGD